jgi:TolA-binding protein
MLDELSDKERYSLIGLFAVSIVAAFGAGTVASGGNMTGAFMEGTGGDASTQQIRQTVESLVSQQTAQQRQQLQQAANGSENLTMNDLSINSQVESVSKSKFDSLYKVSVSTTGEVPRRLGSGTRSIDQTRTLYISSNGRYLFQGPTDLQQPQRQQSPRRP